MDQAILQAERTDRTDIIYGENGDGAKTMPLNREAAWYGSAEARHVADVIVSYQIPSGGWGKNAPRDGALRQPGESWIAGKEDGWHYVGTFDNGATTTEIQFLVRVQAQLPGEAGDRYRAAIYAGLNYIFNAQYPNGGWPQVWPLEGGYHDAVTFNDNALSDIAGVLRLVAAGKGDYAFLPASVRSQAAAALDRAIGVILSSQVRIESLPTAWGQQHDTLTLMPVGARNFEPASLSSSESAALLLELMQVENPSDAVVASVHAGAAWLKSKAITGVAWVKAGNDKALVQDANAKPLWARYYSLETGEPIFGDRDLTIHDDVMEISAERRNGYAWYGTSAQKALDVYAEWSQKHPQ
jgi:PelA/Pel-15E family pectate lyase